MKVQEFLLHHGIDRNPFAEEDADSDSVFKRHCIAGTYHPAWGKILGNPDEPSTSVVFGEKGSGKSALRLQIVERLEEFNRERPDERVFVIPYDDFNPFLERFAERVAVWRRDEEKALGTWRLWDHIDAILSVGVTRLSDAILRSKRREDSGDEAFRIDPRKVASLPRAARRDILLLAAFYDQSTTLPPRARWERLRRRLGFFAWPARWDVVFAVVWSIAVLGGAAYWAEARSLLTPWPWIGVLLGWLVPLWRWFKYSRMARQVHRELRVVNLNPEALTAILKRLGRRNLENQPIPTRNQSVDRYDLLKKFQEVLGRLGYKGITILIDRVDEPHLLHGSPERMRLVIWPLLDNKFLTLPGIGVKLLLPNELTAFISREDKSFYEKSRLDKHNLIRSLEWSGQSLYDVASDRLSACRMNGNGRLFLRDLFDEDVSEPDLISALSQLRVPRHLFKFLHRLIVDHCTRFTDDNPRWQFSSDTFRACHALYLRDLQSFDRGLGTG